MRSRPVGFLLAAAVLLAGVVLLATRCAGGSGASTTARSGCFRYRVTPAQPADGWVLAVNVIATNVSGSPCSGRHCGGLTGGFVVTDAGGHEVMHEGPAGVMCRSDAPAPEQVRQGGSVVWASFRWDGLGDLAGPRCVPGDCHLTRPRLKRGRYRVTWTWLDAVSVRSGWLHTSTS